MSFALRRKSAGIQMLRSTKLIALAWNATLYIKKPYTDYLFHKHELN